MRNLFLISTKKMCKTSRLKIRKGEELIPENIAIITLEKVYRKIFESYWNKKGEGFKVYVTVFDEDWNKELDIHYEDVFPTRDKAIEEWEKFLQQWLGDVRVTYL